MNRSSNKISESNTALLDRLFPNKTSTKSVPVSRSTKSKIAGGANGHTFYHVIFDVDINQRNSIGQNRPLTHGNIKTLLSEKNGIPLLDSLIDAQVFAKKMVDRAVKRGTADNKQFPVTGAVILGFKIGEDVVVRDKGNVSQDGGADYGILSRFLDQSKSDMTLYTVETPDPSSGEVRVSKRAIITPDGLAKCELYSASYGFKTGPAHTVFAILNNKTNMSEGDIELLKEIYDKSDGDYYRFHDQIPVARAVETSRREQMRQPNEPVLSEYEPTKVTVGEPVDDRKLTELDDVLYQLIEGKKKDERDGKQDDEQDGGYKKYKAEKARYLHLKKIAKQRGLI